MRRGEALGVKWEDVDLTGGVLNVRRSRVWLAGGFVDNAPKTLRGERTVTLDTVTVERVKAMRAVRVIAHASRTSAHHHPDEGADSMNLMRAVSTGSSPRATSGYLRP